LELTRLRVSGFKSFSEPVELQLEAGLTGIVGPNGCGKSNIVEALRWAMGESSAKGLRGDGMEDVIFNGSASRPAHDVAEVRLKLKGRPEGLAGFTEEGELEVARRIARGVGSTYRINGREARARDVQMLFADAGAGSRSPAIVGQGQIGFIVDAKPGERRKLLEDAAGIGGLQARRREAELRLEATRANLQRVLDLLGTQEARLAELTKQGRQAQRYRQIAAELRATEANLLLARYAEAARRAGAGNEQVTALGGEAERQEQAVAGLRAARAAIAGTLPALRERVAGLQAQVTGLSERLAGLREASGREAGHLAALARQQDEAGQDLARSEHSLVELRSAMAEFDGEATALAETRARAAEIQHAAQAEDEAATAALAAAQDDLRTIVARAAEAAAQRDSALERLAMLRQREAVLTAELAALPAVEAQRAAADRARQALTEHEAATAAARAALDQAAAALAQLEPEREAGRETALAAERALAAARAEQDRAQVRLREARAAIQRLGERRTALERGLGRMAERRASLARRRELLAAGGGDAAPAALQQALTEAEAELAAADTILDAGHLALAAAEQGQGEALARQRDLRRSADALEAEIRVLESLAPLEGVAGLIDRLDAPEELTQALAAALGDDVLAGTDAAAPCHWTQAGELPQPALPAGVTALLELVRAPEVLAARLARTGLVAAEEAVALQPNLLPGHRLVSRDGGLWRWDGFVRAPSGEDPAAVRVRHQLRLHAARDERAELPGELAAAEAATGAGEEAVGRARAALAEAETRWRAADTAQLRARERLDEAQALATRRAAETTQIEQEEASLARDAVELEREGAELANLAGLDGEVATAAAVLVEIERQVADAAGRHAAAETERRRLDAAHAEAQRRQRAQDQAVFDSGTALERARIAATELGREAAELEADRRARTAALERERAELATGLAERKGQAHEAVTLAEQRMGERAVVEAALAVAEATRHRQAERLAEARAVATTKAQRADAVARARQEAQARYEETCAVRAELSQRLERLQAERAEAKRTRRSDPAAISGLEAELAQVTKTAEAERTELNRREAEAAAREAELNAAESALAVLRERLAVAQAERGHAHEALAASVAAVRDRLQQEPLNLLAEEGTRAAVAVADLDELEARLMRLRASRDRLGPVNLRADVEAGELETSLAETRAREAELQQAVDRLRAGIATLDGEARQRLTAAFEAVDGHFRRLFTTLFGGGKAHLRLTGADDPLQAGLELEASPPGKKLSSISLLSGGEKTLTALALVFGFFLAQPSPLCVLDEVDAPLDDANVDRFVALMQEIAQATGTRFLVVTHHPLTMARMDRLYGVTMAERGISRLVSVALERALELRATA
jgi:chromosome segregation protein